MTNPNIINSDLPIKEAMYYTKLTNNNVQCLICPRKCIIKAGQRGFCNARINKKGKLYTLVYGRTVLKPDYIFSTRSLIYTTIPYNMLKMGTGTCNLKCKFCITWPLSQAKPEDLSNITYASNQDRKAPVNNRKIDAITQASVVPNYFKPEDIINYAKVHNCKIINYTLSEPAVYYEYMLEIAKLARKEGLINILATSGYINKEPLMELLKYIDGVSFSIKGFTNDFYQKYCSAEIGPVLETLKLLEKEGVNYEITYVVIPTLNDDSEQIRKMCLWIKENLGEDTQLHFYRYHPSYLLQNLPPTPIATLEAAREIAYKSGLKYVYIYYLGEGLAPDFEEKLYCPNCKKLILYRKGRKLPLVNNTSNGRCKFCGAKFNRLMLDVK